MNTAATLTKFEMTVDLNVLEHLGINLYSNIAAGLGSRASLGADRARAILVDPNRDWI